MPGSKLYVFGGWYMSWDGASTWEFLRYDDMFEFNLDNYTWSDISNTLQNRPASRFVLCLV